MWGENQFLFKFKIFILPPILLPYALYRTSGSALTTSLFPR